MGSVAGRIDGKGRAFGTRAAASANTHHGPVGCEIWQGNTL